MEVIRAIKERRSVRNFKSRGISARVLANILEAAAWAPSSRNIQPVRLIVIDDEDVKKKIVRAFVDPSGAQTAPILVVVCSSVDDVEHFFGKRGRELYDPHNAAAAIQNILLAATHYGVASNWVAAFSESAVRRILKIPKEINLHAIIPLGYPVRVPKAPTRIPTAYTTYFNEWENTDYQRFRSIYPLLKPPALEKSNAKAKRILAKIKRK